jgi:hypothetical protein
VRADGQAATYAPTTASAHNVRRRGYRERDPGDALDAPPHYEPHRRLATARRRVPPLSAIKPLSRPELRCSASRRGGRPGRPGA